MDEILKELLIELGDAASEAVDDSEKVAAIREEIDRLDTTSQLNWG